jgi:hypothetical protein
VIIGIIVLPMLFDLNGIWLTIPFAEFITLIVSLYLTKRYSNYYRYA